MFIDARIPVHLDAAPPEAAVLVEGRPVAAGETGARFDLVATGHTAGCACCLPRNPAAGALTRLFAARARGEVAFFTAVSAAGLSAAGQDAVRAALADDPVASARFRLV